MERYLNADSVIAFISTDKAELERLQTVVVKFGELARQSSPEDKKSNGGFGPAWLGRILNAHGLEADRCSCNGCIAPIHRHNKPCVIKHDDSEYVLAIKTNDEYTTETEVWDLILMFYPHTHYVYACENWGEQIYINTDTTGKYFPEKYMVEVYGTELEEVAIQYCKTEQEVLKFATSIYNVEFDSIEDIKKYMHDNKCFGGSCFLDIQEFKQEVE